MHVSNSGVQLQPAPGDAAQQGLQDAEGLVASRCRGTWASRCREAGLLELGLQDAGEQGLQDAEGKHRGDLWPRCP